MGTRIMVQTNADIGCGAGSPKTVLTYKAPTGVAAKVLRRGVSFNGTTSTDARATIDLVKKPSTAGTGTEITSGIATLAGKTTTIGTSFQDFSAEPGSDGSTRVLMPHLQAPTGPYSDFVGIELDPAEQIGLRVYGASGKTCRAWMEIELG
jgi:hypothetical protein